MEVMIKALLLLKLLENNKLDITIDGIITIRLITKETTAKSKLLL